jgi:hypothetical protein
MPPNRSKKSFAGPDLTCKKVFSHTTLVSKRSILMLKSYGWRRTNYPTGRLYG